MSEDKKHSILFILNNEKGGIKPALPEICKILTKAGHDIHIAYASNINEDYEISLRKVPWIHAQKLPLENKFSMKQLSVPLAIRRYIKRHDGIDIIHSFGLYQGIFGYLASIGLKTININTPDEINLEKKEDPKNILKQFVKDNITYIFNRLYNLVLFASNDEKTKALGHISYRNIKTETINTTENMNELSDNVLSMYDKAKS